jgi:hypothetical protein
MAVALGAAFALVAFGQVSPPTIDQTLAPGEWYDVEKTVTVPEYPPKLDVYLIVDLSGSYYDDLPNIKSLAPGIFDTVKAEVDDVKFGLGTFVDFPFAPWGYAAAGDYAYRRDQDLTPNGADWLAAVNAMATRSGYDGPESQYEALYQTATGAGRDVTPPGNSPGDIPADRGASFREDATKVVIITTDAPFHNAGDPGPFPYPGPTRDDTVDALVAAGIKVIALKAPGSGGQMDDVAAATGGVVKSTSSTSDDIADAILGALEELTFTIAPTVEGCDPLVVTFDPESIEDVSGPTDVYFMESIEVPADVTGDELTDGSVHCTVTFKADDTELGTQDITIRVRRTVGVDIKPGSFPNSINVNPIVRNGVIPVAILGSATFDVGAIDRTTLAFAALGATPVHKKLGHLEDVNGDGYVDLVSHYRVNETGIMVGDVEACVVGETTDGIAFRGCDSVRPIINP